MIFIGPKNILSRLFRMVWSNACFISVLIKTVEIALFLDKKQSPLDSWREVKELKERGKMYSYYKIEKNQIRESSEEDYNWLVVKHGNEEEKKSCWHFLIYRKIFLLAPMNQRKFLD